MCVNRQKERFGWNLGAALFVLLSGAVACDDEDASKGNAAEEAHAHADGEADHEHDNTKKPDAGSASSDAGSASSDADVSSDAAPSANQSTDVKKFFVVPTEVYGADFADSTSYIPVVSSLDVEEISLDNAKELNGRASVGVVGKWLFIAGSTEPVVTRYEITEDGKLKEDGKLNFMNYGVPEFFAIDSWGALFVNEEKAYIFNGSDGSHIVWNPTTLEITGEIKGPDVTREGYNLESIAVVRGNRMYRIFTLLNYDTWEFLRAPQYLAVYDLDKDEIIELVEETRCPQLYNRPFIDEKGDIYFSGWVWTPGLALTSDYPKSCALRVKKDEDVFDQDYKLNFADITDGREGAMLRYLGKGQALLDVFHAERVEGGINKDTDAQELVNLPNWRLWKIDLEKKSGGPIESLDYKAGGFTDVAIDGRNFLLVPNEDYSETTAYELQGDEAVKGFKIRGSSYDMRRVR